MYNCGPTVYSSPHIGNYRAYVFTDLLRRYLDFRGYDVTQVMNLTDVGHLRDEEHDAGEDRMEAAARREGLDPWKIAEKYTAEFFDGLDLLNIRRAHHYPRATDHVGEMIEIISGLIDKGLAYVVDDEVYFDVAKFEGYGRLSGNVGDDLRVGASERVAEDVMEKKRHPRDFALWKADPHHIMQWDSPWGRGFPGWHIECSAMARKYLGDTLDIHTGGVDNIFPHHECEIAQSEGFTGRPFVRTWLHVAHLNLDGAKMAKSEGNILVPRHLIAEGFSPRDLRYYLLSVHYRQPMRFTREGMTAATNALERLTNCVDRLVHRSTRGDPGSSPSVAVIETIDETRARFIAALDDDLNISQGLAALFDLVRELNSIDLNASDARAALAFFREIDEILGVLPVSDSGGDLEAEIEAQIAAREDARRNKDFAAADRIRDELLARDIILMDTPEGVRWRKKD